MNTSRNRISLLSSLVASLCVTSWASAQSDFFSEEDLFNEDLPAMIDVYDPFESINKYTFQFNDYVYTNVLDPFVEGYRYITPDPVERGAANFFDNLKYPVRLGGNLLQGKFENAWRETGRFAINSTVGVLGIFKPADKYEYYSAIPPEDIGQAFGSWGIGEGPYLVIPLLGPSNLRDFGGFFGDRAINPLKEPFSVIDSWELETALAVSEFVAESPSLLQRYNQLKQTSIDPYSAIKNGYTEYRRGAIKE